MKKLGQMKATKKFENISNENMTFKEESEEKKKFKTKKRKRLIIRNLSFQASKEEVQEVFSKFGNVVEVSIPLNKDGRKRGFAFVEFDNTKSLINAMKAMNNHEIHGRRVAIDFAIDKTTYQIKLQGLKKEKESHLNNAVKKEAVSGSEDESGEEKPDIKPDNDLINVDLEENCDEKEKLANDFLKEFESGFEKSQNTDSYESSSDDSDESDGSYDSEDEKEMDDEEDYDSDSVESVKNSKLITHKNVKSNQKKLSKSEKKSDVSEGKTVFLRNVSFSTTNEILKECMEKYGECAYCVICIDPCTDHPKGTAFVKFKDKECADKLIQESYGEPGVLVDGRKLTCTLALNKADILQQNSKEKQPKDKRNLKLLKVGLIMPNSPESEGVSKFDMSKRAQLEMFKNQKLKNVNFFVSDIRLMVHNVPKTLNDVELRKIFKKVAGKGAVITEARVMREFKKTNAEGIPLSKGFGFVSFSKHEDALKALTELNNNPHIFTNQNRPIVEFSVENKVALLSKERRKERIQQRSKRRMEEKQEKRASGILKYKSETGSGAKISNRKNKKRKRTESIEKDNKKPCNSNNTFEDKISDTKSKKKQKKTKPKNKRNNEKRVNNQQNFSNMVNEFKEKLLNKM